jgi:outer membrane protein TolC
MKFPPSSVALAIFLLAGCTTYRSKPLDRSAVDAALQGPAIESVKIEASRLSHPILAPVVIDGSNGYSPDEIAVMAVLLSRDLRALRDQQGVADAQVLQAGILPNPQLGYSVDRPHGVYDPPAVAGKSLGLSWDLTSLLTHRDAVAAARAQSKSLNLSIAWAEWQTAQDARLRAFRILSLEERLPLAREAEAELAGVVSAIQKALEGGQKTGADLTAATDAWTQAQDARFDLENQLTSDKAALNLELGQPEGESVRLKPAGAFPLLSADVAAEGGSLLQGLEDRRLDLVALRYGYDSQEATLRAAVLAQFPKIGLSVTKANDTTPIYTRGGGVTVDLPVFDRNQGQVAIGKATRQQLFDEYVARVAEARSKVGEVLASLAIARAQLAAADASILDLQRVADACDAALKTGNSDILTCSGARAALATRQMDRSRIRQSVLELGVALEIATGRALLNQSLTHS